VNLGQINELSFVQCTARFVIIGGRDQIAGYTYSGDPVLAEVTLKNLSNFPINFSHCQLLFETNINDVKTTSQVLDEYLIQTDDGLYQFKNLPFHLLAESTKKFYFCTRANLELDTVRNNYEKYITVFFLFLDSQFGCFRFARLHFPRFQRVLD
jgi:hypothetical protein